MTIEEQKPLIGVYTSLCPIVDQLENMNEVRKQRGKEARLEYDEIRKMLHAVTTRCSELLR